MPRPIKKDDAWIEDLAKRLAEIRGGSDAGWGIWADLIRAHLPASDETMKPHDDKPRDPIHVIHETANWLGNYLARLGLSGERFPEGAEYIYDMLLRSEAQNVGAIMHEHGRRENG